ncbi:MAG TPA: LysR family transcriptional regulator [Candidatus Blautia gallistercoris]|uniref:LysR family transcriptional regulator n=1 Tax=Candidatus Blautia gallistercoris TaxID=2838490 RepID=A0A9D2B2P8_9FIRM|nr:LysR family transcriptional regulator [Candidatus Blautia gallistercoris]
MEFYQLEQFLSLAQTCNMHVTAEQLHITQPALSKSLKKLEAELECPLFERRRNKLVLNEYGKILLQHSSAIMEEIQQLRKEIWEQQEKSKVFITCSGYAIAALYFIMPHIAHAFPHRVFLCSVEKVTDYSRLFEEGKFDFILSNHKYNSNRYENVQIFEEELMITVPNDCALHANAQEKIEMEQLRQIEKFILPDTPGYTEWFRQVLEEAGVQKERISYYPIEKYLNSKAEFQFCNLCSSLIIHFVPEITGKTVYTVNSEHARKQIYAVFRKKDRKKLEPLITYLRNETNNLFRNVSFLPYFMFRNESSNLLFK